MKPPTNRPSIALLSLSHDPSQPLPLPLPFSSEGISLAPETGVRSLAQALAHVGWQVNVFTHQSPELSSTIWMAAHCRVIRLPVTTTAEPVAQFAQTLRTFQLKTGLIWPLFHTLDEASAPVGAYLKREEGWRWIHTPGFQATGFQVTGLQNNPKSSSVDQLVLLRLPSIPVASRPTDVLGSGGDRLQYQALHPLDPTAWDAIAKRLSDLYRQHLAVYVGAIDLKIPQVCELPLPLTMADTPKALGLIHATEKNTLNIC
ncbi:MAG: hypothetical protein F6J95_021440 [Leptolyngbya sp. SIO1E4]|nr:hypothetical protein [Leptolyngbya sp. SIO1E4]